MLPRGGDVHDVRPGQNVQGVTGDSGVQPTDCGSRVFVLVGIRLGVGHDVAAQPVPFPGMATHFFKKGFGGSDVVHRLAECFPPGEDAAVEAGAFVDGLGKGVSAAGFGVDCLFRCLCVLRLLFSHFRGLYGRLLFHGICHGIRCGCLGLGLFVALVHAIGRTTCSDDCGGDTCYCCCSKSHGYLRWV